MTEIVEALLPKSVNGNDPNDHQHDPEYISKLHLTSVPSEEKSIDSSVEQAIDNQDDLAVIFTEKYRRELRYVPSIGKWYVWDGTRWVVDIVLAVYDLIRRLCRQYCSSNKETRKKMLNGATISAIERMVRSDPAHAITLDVWDQNDWVLNTPAGIVNLESGETTPHNPEAYCTMITGAGPEGTCPEFLKFLHDITEGDEDLIGFLQRIFGYACTGSTKGHALFFFYGTGGNGKGTLLNTILDILNDYSVTAPMSVFTESKHNAHPTELALLMNARLVVAQETNEGKRWDEARIKTLTGADPITARFMRQDFFTFLPKFTLIIAGNHKPSLYSVDPAIKRRVHLIPFNVTIPKDKCDPDLPEKLKAESAGIMQWMIDGVLDYSEIGLSPPQSVLDATKNYFDDEDVYQQWVKDCCVTGKDCRDAPTDLFESWKEYATEGNLNVGNTKTFKSKLESMGFHQTKTGTKGRRYKGIEVKAQKPNFPTKHMT